MAYSGKYKGISFRSLLELSVIRHLESEGLVLGVDMIYEGIKIPYGKTKIRNYIVDLMIPTQKLLIEVKPASRAENRNNTAKRVGAEKWCTENGWTYVIITEEELNQCGDIVTLDAATKLVDVQLNERAKRAHRRKEAVRARKKRKKK